MSRIKNNQLVQGASGNFGKQFVYKQRGNKTHIAKMPVTDKNAEPTEKQVEVRELFGSAALYAKAAISSPDLKKEYEKKVGAGRTAYNIAFRDYLKAPKVKEIIAGKYNGSPGSVIVVSAKDDFRVVAVTVSIRSAAGTLIEEGDAVLNPKNHNQWIYTATQNNAALIGSTVTAVAKDLPENEGTMEINL